MMEQQAIDYLRHRPPFLFIESFNLRRDGAWAAITPASVLAYGQRGEIGSFWFLAECSAQLFGCYCRANQGDRGKPGYLVNLRSVEWLGVGEVAYICVQETENQSMLRRYTAQCKTSSGKTVMAIEGAIAMPDYLIHKEKPTNSSEEESCQGNNRAETGVGVILRRENNADNAELHLQFHAKDPIYEGHFPEDPIVPGVFLGEVMTDFALWMSGGARPKIVLDLVFSAFVRPSDTIVVRMKRITDGFSCSVLSRNKRAARAKLLFD